jgi:hypothetical protein
MRIDDEVQGDEAPTNSSNPDRARQVEIERVLRQAALTKLRRAELVAEWVRIQTPHILGQHVRKSRAGRPRGGVAEAARRLPVPGKGDEARRKFVMRAVEIDGLPPEVKAAVRALSLDDNQSALIAVARSGLLDAQLTKLHDIAAIKASPRRKSQGYHHPSVKSSAPSRRAGELAFEAVELLPAGPTVELVPPVEKAHDEASPVGRPLSIEHAAVFSRLVQRWDREMQPAFGAAPTLVREKLAAEIQSRACATPRLQLGASPQKWAFMERSGKRLFITKSRRRAEPSVK